MVGGKAQGADQFVAIVKADDDVGIADVDCQKHEGNIWDIGASANGKLTSGRLTGLSVSGTVGEVCTSIIPSIRRDLP